MNITPLSYIYIYIYIYIFLYLSVNFDYISYRTRTDTCIQITINFIYNAWITDIYRDFFGPYIEKLNYCFIIDMESSKASIVKWKIIVRIESYHACAHWFLYHKKSPLEHWRFLDLFTLGNFYLYLNHYKKTFQLPWIF